MLTSDNYLRIFNVDLDRETPEQAIELSQNSVKSSTFADSKLSMKAR